jgi:hypothetical protein
MSEANYNHVIAEIKTLNISDQLRVLEKMAAIIREKTSAGSTRSILELKGKGKSIWKGLDVKAYINQERSSWNG